MESVTVGLLPLYIKLYDDAAPDMRLRMEKFYGTIAGELEEWGLQVLTSPICRLHPEFKQAVKRFDHHSTSGLLPLS